MIKINNNRNIKVVVKINKEINKTIKNGINKTMNKGINKRIRISYKYRIVKIENNNRTEIILLKSKKVNNYQTLKSLRMKVSFQKKMH